MDDLKWIKEILTENSRKQERPRSSYKLVICNSTRFRNAELGHRVNWDADVVDFISESSGEREHSGVSKCQPMGLPGRLESQHERVCR